MKLETRRIFSKTVAIVTLFCMATQNSFALLNLANQPLFIGNAIPPQVMLTISKDQQLFKKAYNDYSDLDPVPDGVLETTYKKTIKYYGYFDSAKCYDYSVASGRFEPFALADADMYCVGANAGKWSGNFLNWVTMTRMDTVRKLLYGGLRSTDGTGAAGITVLERAYLPTDAHSFAKFYAGQIDQATGAVIDSDIDRLTPFAAPAAVQTTSATPQAVAPSTASGQAKVFTVASTAGFQTGHQVQLTATAGVGAGHVLRGPVTAIGVGTITVFVDTTTDSTGGSIPGGACSALPIPGGCTTGTAWTVNNLTVRGITFCNTTLGGSTGPLGTDAPVAANANNRSQTHTHAPLIRVTAGDYALWGAQ